MDFMDISKMRITTRQFDKTPVEKDKIDRILEAGRWAPTAMDAQPQRILVLSEPEHLDKVREFCTFGVRKEYREIDSNCDQGDAEHNVFYYGAPLVLLVCYDRTVCWSHPESGESMEPMTFFGREGLVSEWFSIKEQMDGLEARKQEEAEMTYDPMLKKEMGEVDFSAPAVRVKGQINGLNPWPCASVPLGEGRLKLMRAALAEGSGAPGTVLKASPREGLIIACGGGAVRILELQAPGGKKMRAEDFLRGHELPRTFG